MKAFRDEQQQEPSAAPRGPERECLEELEYNWVRLRWRYDGAVEEGRTPRDAQRKRQINRGNFSFGDPADPATSPLRTVTDGVLSPPLKAM